MPPKKKARILSLDDPTFSDLTLKFGDDNIRHVHKNILCSKSGWFTTALTSTFKESKSAEIVLEDDDPVVLHAMLDWCYHGQLETAVNEWRKNGAMTFRTRLFQIADKYDVPALKEAIEEKFRKRLRPSRRDLRPLNDGPDITERDLVKALKLMYEMPDAVAAELRGGFLIGLSNKFKKYIRKDWFQDLITEQPGIARDILQLMGCDKLGDLICKYRCTSCNSTLYSALEKTDDQGELIFNDLDLKYCPFCNDEQAYMQEEDEDNSICL
ncbi:hypothetical protein MBLNU457_1369t1 [Dothideomycetes sp. NU457]